MPCILPPTCYLLCIEGFSLGIIILGIKLTSEDEDLVLRLRMSEFVFIFLAEYARIIPLLPVYTFMAWTFIQFYIFYGSSDIFLCSIHPKYKFWGMLVGSLTLC